MVSSDKLSVESTWRKMVSNNIKGCVLKLCTLRRRVFILSPTLTHAILSSDFRSLKTMHKKMMG